MQTKDERLDGLVFTNADPRYARKFDDPQRGDTTMLMQQARKVMTVNQELENKSSGIWLDWVSAAVGICERESR